MKQSDVSAILQEQAEDILGTSPEGSFEFEIQRFMQVTALLSVQCSSANCASHHMLVDCWITRLTQNCLQLCCV